MISDDGTAQLNDFGISRILTAHGFITKAAHNMRYTAPELLPLEEVAYDPRPTKESDVFSFAMLLLQVRNSTIYFLFVAYTLAQIFNHRQGLELQPSLPYNHIRLVNDNGANEMKLLRRIHAGERPQRERYQAMGDVDWETITWCWQGNPRDRPSITQVLNRLQ